MKKTTKFLSLAVALYKSSSLDLMVHLLAWSLYVYLCMCVCVSFKPAAKNALDLANQRQRSSSGPLSAHTLFFGARRLGFCLCLGSCLRLGASNFKPHQDFGVWRTVEAYRLSSLDFTV